MFDYLQVCLGAVVDFSPWPHRVVCGGKAKHSLLFQGFYFKCEALHCHSWEHKRKLKFTIYQM